MNPLMDASRATLGTILLRLALPLVLVGGLAGAVQAGPKIEHWQATTGSGVYFVENHDLPVVDVEIAFAAGAALDAPGKSGLAAMTQGLLDLGTDRLSETQIADRLADLGAVLGGGVDMDHASVSLRTLSADARRIPALALLQAVLSRPQFPDKVIARERARTVEGLKEALTRPETIAQRAFWAALYPQHPYGRQVTEDTIRAIRRADVQAFYRQHYRAAQATVSIVGDLTRAQAEALAVQITAGLPDAARSVTAERDETLAVPALPQAMTQRMAHPAKQAHVLIGLPALRRGDPDYFPLLVGNYVLGGGGFVSRLMREVREQRGYAYGVYSGFQTMTEAGPFQIGLQTRKDQADAALAVVRAVLERFLAEGPSEDELNAARQNLIGSFPLRLDSNRKILDHVSTIGHYGLPLDYLDRYAEQIAAVSRDDVRAAFARHVRPDHLVTIVVGAPDRATPEPTP